MLDWSADERRESGFCRSGLGSIYAEIVRNAKRLIDGCGLVDERQAGMQCLMQLFFKISGNEEGKRGTCGLIQVPVSYRVNISCNNMPACFQMLPG